jgi:hypothetical protein
MTPLPPRASSLLRAVALDSFRPPSTRTSVLRRYQHASSESRLPRLVQSSFWDSIIPKTWRNRPSGHARTTKAKPTNPATYFIWIYILIGSQAIRIMGVKNEFTVYSRKAELKLQQLREVVQKLQRGEEVDVEKVLGTGDETQEREWEEALEELQREDRIWQDNRNKSREAKERLAKEEQDANPVHDDKVNVQAQVPVTPTPQPTATRRPGFY